MRRLLLAATLALAAVALPARAADNVTQLQKIDRVAGTGTVARDGDVVQVNYTVWLYDANAADHHGKEVDSSLDSGEPISFTLGAGQVIAGWTRASAACTSAASAPCWFRPGWPTAAVAPAPTCRRTPAWYSTWNWSGCIEPGPARHASTRSPASASAITRLRPARLARYSAASASRHSRCMS